MNRSSLAVALTLALTAAPSCRRTDPSAGHGHDHAHGHDHGNGVHDHAMPGAAAPGAFRMELRSDPTPPRAGQPTTLTFDPRRADGTRVPELAVVHEKRLHQIIVSRDLSWFAHEHPDLQPDGTLRLAYTFPRAGEMLLYSDFTPAGEGQVVSRNTLRVEGDAPAAVPLVVDDLAQAKTSGAFAVTLRPTTREATRDSWLHFAITSNGQPVTDLRPYLGALGHCVIVSEDGNDYLHSHPRHEPVGEGVLAFHTRFPRAGRYKLWAEFRPRGETLLVSFVLEATPRVESAAR